MAGGGDVVITIADGGPNTAISLPASSVRVKIGVLLAGAAVAAYQLVSTRDPVTLQKSFLGGQLMEAAALVTQAGGTVIAMGVPINTPGTATAVVPTVTNGSTTTVTVTLDGTNGAWDQYYAVLKWTKAGTRGTAGVTFQLSLDAGRTFGPNIALGTAVTYVIPGTGITLNFGAGTMAVGDSYRFSTTAPTWTDASIATALTTLQNSTYALVGWGGIHIVGVSGGSDASTFQGNLGGSPDGTGGLAGGYVYTRAILDTRDLLAPTAWGGSGELESTWMASLQTDFSATSAVRCCASAGYYNMPSAYPNAAGGAPKYRRSLGWALDARECAIPPQRHAGRVKDGPLGAIVVGTSSDPNDGFVYHDERINPGLTGARFCAAKTRVKKQGFFIDQPNLLAPTGSVFTLLPYGNVMDIACDVVFEVGENEIDDDLRDNANGTLYVSDALELQNLFIQGLKDNMTSQGMISDQNAVVDQTANVGANGKVPVKVSVTRNGYVLEMDINIGFTSPDAAGA